MRRKAGKSNARGATRPAKEDGETERPPAKRAGPKRGARHARNSASKDEARASEKGAPKGQNSADEVDEGRRNAESLREDSFEDAAARKVKGSGDG